MMEIQREWALLFFADADAASKAIRHTGKRLKGRALRINMASDKPGGRR